MAMYQNEMLTASNTDLDTLLADVTATLRHWMNDQAARTKTPAEQRMPAGLLDRIMKIQPLSVAIPEAYGGRGGLIKESMRLLAATSYESLEMSMIFGINMFLFMQPVVKYADATVKADIFRHFLRRNQMGGFMLTEPDFGSDVLNLATSYTDDGNRYRISGRKHWQGLTGHATYWLVAARKKHASGELVRDIDFFIADGNQKEQQIEVLKYYDSLGLYMLPYGLNKIEVSIPKEQKLRGTSTGITMMLDILHNSRLQFPGMAMGFIERVLDEAIAYCSKRQMGGASLLAYDQVQYQISRIQAAYTICAAMCAKTCTFDSAVGDASGLGLDANSMKTVVTDLMHESAQTLLQLSGAKGYRLSEYAGRAVIDSRPFQIFEGPNDMLYNQIAETVLRGMKITRQNNLFNYLSQTLQFAEAVDLFRNELNLTIDFTIAQRKKITLGRIIARVVTAVYVLELMNKGYNRRLIDGAIALLRQDVIQLLGSFQSMHQTKVVTEYREQGSWFEF
ncbi:acyl-CoA dehydrogenase family protein [Taibaiella soli]|uniref:Acyl-CoA dehydrogenase n=1 Tax=Taibaiella soli TaxID=1649169 RepID=A0A2W2AW25_9BACT|nr:acyl-CoA dehydrogenase family protein [Taibaiella soli]PZF71888.1 acyl-CoA dehydrogenase [Taibaiella soli]